jgi:sec-independent protein translocase protein TatC
MSTTQDSGASRGARAVRISRNGKANPEGRMPLMEHIRELRTRLLKAVAGLALGMVGGWFLFNPVWSFLERPYCNIRIHNKVQCTGAFGHTLVVNAVFGGFFLHIKIALLVGLVISSPVWSYQFWSFIAPGLYIREKRWTYVFVAAAVPLFVLGSFFAYLAMGKAMGFFVHMIPNGAAATFTVDTYLSYVTAMLLIFGLAFEVPLLLVVLNLAGVLSHSFFRKHRRLLIFGVFVFAGAATPSPDWMSMLLLAVPCVVLVEVSEVAILLNDRRRARREAAELENDDISRFDSDDSVDADSSL